MNSPQTRREAAIERSADALHDLLTWQPPSRRTPAPGRYLTMSDLADRSSTRRVVFTGRFWMSDTQVAAWRHESKADAQVFPHRPVALLDAQAEQAGAALRPVGIGRGELLPDGQFAGPPAKKATCFEELSLVPMEGPGANEEIAAVQRLAGLELRVEVVKFHRPAAGANGVSTGRVLAVSGAYAAQSVGNGNVVIHENASLDRELQPNERVTVAYQDGKASVYDGLLHDINVDANWLSTEQRGYLRRTMLEALALMEAPQDDDERLKDALRYALEATANFYGLAETKLARADLSLTVNDKRMAGHPPQTPQDLRGKFAGPQDAQSQPARERIR